MILVDTSVWVDHLRSSDAGLVQALQTNAVLIHPFIIGELACGNLKDRSRLLSLIGALPGSAIASEQEVLYFIEQKNLMGRGIGYIDVHLLASVSIKVGASIWTRDLRLLSVAKELGLAFMETQN